MCGQNFKCQCVIHYINGSEPEQSNPQIHVVVKMPNTLSEATYAPKFVCT